jgi:predicted N-acetyltransferase YhbS
VEHLIEYRVPTVEEFQAVVAAVGFRAHSVEAIRIGLSNTWCSVCAVADGAVVGLGRVVGDGALHFYITNVMVVPTHQRRGIGSSIVRALLSKVQMLPYPNVLVEALPLPGLDQFYGRLGFKAARTHAPGMHMWLNEDEQSGEIARANTRDLFPKGDAK